MARLKLLIGVVLLAGCASGHLRNLPEARSGVLAFHDASDPDARRATVIARKLSAASPLPVEKVYVASSGFLNARLGPGKFPDDNASTFRCGQGNPPPYGCIYVGDRLLATLSDDALAGILAYELGHLERGHRRSGLRNAAGGAPCQEPAYTVADAFIRLMAGCGVADVRDTAWAAGEAYASREVEREADAAGIERLTAAGYCAGPLMRATFAELSKLLPEKGSGGLLGSHPGYSERWERAGSDCRRPTPARP